jgi:excisionase family DNA binding protein
MQQLLSIERAADLLSLSPWTVRTYEREGKITSVRIGRRVLFREQDLAKFVEDRVSAPVSESLQPA